MISIQILIVTKHEHPFSPPFRSLNPIPLRAPLRRQRRQSLHRNRAPHPHPHFIVSYGSHSPQFRVFVIGRPCSPTNIAGFKHRHQSRVAVISQVPITSYLRHQRYASHFVYDSHTPLALLHTGMREARAVRGGQGGAGAEELGQHPRKERLQGWETGADDGGGDLDAGPETYVEVVP